MENDDNRMDHTWLSWHFKCVGHTQKRASGELIGCGWRNGTYKGDFYAGHKQWSIQDAAIGAIPGLLLLGIALVQGGVGTRDGLVLLILGGLLGRKACVGGFLWGSFGAAAAAGLFWWFGKKSSHWRFPFLPFLTVGVILEKLLEGMI